MDVAPEDRQAELAEVARRLFAARCPTDVVRDLEGSPDGHSPDLWREMARLGWLGLGQPGTGSGIADLVALYTEMGRALVPSPHLPSAVVAAQALVAAGGRDALVAEMAAGEAIVVPALAEESGEYDPDALTVRAEPDGGGHRLSGTKLLVPFAHVASRLLVAARAPEGVTLFLVDPADCAVERLPNIAGHPLFAVTFDGVTAPADTLVGSPGAGHDLLGPALDRAAVLRCAEIAGAGEALLEMTVRYAKEREQFGQAIGRFQAVQYLCSDIAIDGHLTALLARQAAWALDRGGAARREVAAAKAYGGRAAQRVVHCAHEVHAGMAFMLESDVQLFTRRAKHWEYDLGGQARHEDELVTALQEA
ncbi:acyl-CoA dehydrogenase family protein [Actinomadura decatromicini]|uniref:Acyl-CoA dehydrogenase n=1 Tax=Actinomadura decatromicini TaxID=2604572 RepID=A0A5D3F902_9ACTN|nr:acyl-CoA dehydrogenase [Actinomadura decatromicini]TYK44428.1 acyl-CoA dehydrogenase [Actinomadura decatromicini]